MLWIVDEPQRHGSLEMVKQSTRKLALWNLLAALNSRQVPNVRVYGFGNGREGFFSGFSSLSERLRFTHVHHFALAAKILQALLLREAH